MKNNFKILELCRKIILWSICKIKASKKTKKFPTNTGMMLVLFQTLVPDATPLSEQRPIQNGTYLEPQKQCFALYMWIIRKTILSFIL